MRVASLAGTMLLLASAALAHAGGTSSDYARAAAMPDAVRGKVLNERIGAVWLDEETLVFRRQAAEGSGRLLLVDMRTGTPRDAFDHAAVAKKLSRLLGRELEGDRLSLEPVGRDGWALQVQVGSRVFAVHMETSTVRELDIQDVESLRLEPSGLRRSRGGGDDTAILFVNRSKGPVDLVWLDHGGGRKKYETLAAGNSHRQHTFPGHTWLVLAADGTELGTYTGRPRVGVVVVTGKPAEAAAPMPPRDRRLSPDGRYRAFIREHNVFLRDTRSGKEIRLSEDGTADDAYRSRMLWSDSGRTLMVVQERPAQKRTVHAVNSVPKDRFQPRLVSYDYLKPGDRIAQPRPRLFDVKKRARMEIPEDLYADPWSIGRFSFASERFRFLYNERGHKVLRLIELDPRKRKARAVTDERSDTFIDYSQKTFLREIDEGRSWLWMSERSGWNQLYRVDDKTGEVTPITEGSWVVREVVDVDQGERQIRFTAMGVFPDQDPYHVHVGRVGFDGSGLTWLTKGDGTHSLAFSPDGAHYVDTWSRVDLPPVHELRRAKDGSLVCELARGDWSPLLATGWRPPQRFHAKGRDGKTDIWGVLYLPSNFDEEARYPVIESIYAGPHGHFVPKSFRAWRPSRALAELGFVVVHVDGMGTNWRSKAFHDVCWKNLGDSGFPDRIRWLRAAAGERPYMDISRVGIYGGSAGGQSALRALLAHGDFYDAAVADCGCHDNRMDKIWWNEAWMGRIGPHYEEQSNVTQAHRLEGKLLLIVGEVDRNVDPASTMKVVAALIRADKDFDLLVMPGVGHGAADSKYGRRRLADFFVRHLLGVEPRRK